MDSAKVCGFDPNDSYVSGLWRFLLELVLDYGQVDAGHMWGRYYVKEGHKHLTTVEMGYMWLKVVENARMVAGIEVKKVPAGLSLEMDKEVSPCPKP